MRPVFVRTKSAVTAAGIAVALISLTGFTTPVASQGAGPCNWTAAAADLARQLGPVDDVAVADLRAELLRLGFGPDSRPPTGCGSSTAVATTPNQVLDLANWYLTLPTGSKGRPDTVRQPQLDRYSSPWFQLDGTSGGVVFTANAGGATTANSKYPRSELREMTGGRHASWSNTTGTHTLTLRQAVLTLPVAKPEVVTAQIHDGGDDVVQVRLEGSRLIAQYNDGRTEITLDPNYVLGTPYDLKIVAADRRIRISYNGREMASISRSGSGWYFKTGSYIQSNTGKGDRPDAAAAVVIYRLDVQHSG